MSSNKDTIVLRLIFISLFLIIDTQQNVTCRGSVRSTWGLGPTMTAWGLGLTMTARGQSIGILIGMLLQTLIMSRLDQLSRIGARI